jgi:ribonuclease-3
MFNQAVLEKKIQFYFKNADLVKLAFIHKSYVNEATEENLESNERLEFLGDAVLELVVTAFLFEKFPEKSEGELTPLRSALVRGKNLTKVAKKIDLGAHLILSKGESTSGGREKEYILANVTEALIGAIFLDLGQPKAELFIHKYILSDLDDIIKNNTYLDSKTLLQEKSQELENVTPEYNLIEDHGPDHSKIFKMGVYLNSELIGTGTGSSKQKAEQDAALDALIKKNWS